MRATVHRPLGHNTEVRSTVSRDVLTRFIGELGFDANEVAALEMTPKKIRVTEYHQHPEHGGRYVAEGTTDGIAAVVYTIWFDDVEERD